MFNFKLFIMRRFRSRFRGRKFRSRPRRYRSYRVSRGGIRL